MVGVDAELGEQHVGSEGLQQGRDDGLEGVQVDLVVGVGIQGQVDRVADAIARADLTGKAGAGEQVVPRLVNRDGEHSRVAVEGVLHAVAVVCVDVHVGDAQAALQQVHDGDDGVVEHTETAGVAGRRVVQAAADVERRLDLAVRHHARGGERRAGAEHGGFVHARIGRVVAALGEAETLGLGSGEAQAEGTHGGHVVAGMKRAHAGLVGQGRGDQQRVNAVKRSVGFQQLVGVPQPDGPHGVVLAQHVLAHGVVVDEGGAGHKFIPQSGDTGAGCKVSRNRPAQPVDARSGN